VILYKLTLKKGIKRCDCLMRPRLQPSGWHWPHANWICPVCKKRYWQKAGEEITAERPAVWPGTTGAARWPCDFAPPALKKVDTAR